MANGGKTVRCMSWDDFVAVHEPQLLSIGLPNSLWKKLYQKLSPKEIHDADSSFELRKGQGQDRPWSLHAKRTLPKESGVFLLEHVWRNDGGPTAKDELNKSPELVSKLREVMGLDEGNKDAEMADYLDSVQVLATIGGVSEEAAQKALEGSNNELVEALCRISNKDYNLDKASVSSKLPAEEPLSFEDFRKGFLQTVGAEREGFLSEEYIQKMYERYVRDKQGNPDISSLGTGQTAHYSWSEDDDGSITVYVSIPANAKKRDIVNTLTPKKWTFGIKGKEPIVNGYFHDTISPSDSFWTIDSPGVVQMLLQKPEHGEPALWPVLLKDEKQLTEKEIVLQANQENQEKSDNVSEIMEHMWYYSQTYQAVMSAGGTQESVWYIMNKMGSAIKHSNQPNMKCAPFVYAATGAVISLIWPLKDLDAGDKCTRNVCPLLMPSETAIQQEARVLAFQFDAPEEIPAAFIKQLAEKSVLPKADNLVVNITPPSDENNKDKSPKLTLDLKFYLDQPDTPVQSALKHIGCQLVTSPKDADAVWISGSFLADNFTAEQRVNRLKGEEFLLERHLLSRLVQESFGEVSWFPVVYDLRSQLPAVYADYRLAGFPSYWVIKSANPSKFPLKPVVSSNLKRISRLVETGPVVASKLCLQTAIYQKRNFCLQYSVVVESSKPPVLLIHQTPNIRLATKECDALQPLDEYDSSAILTSAKKNAGKTITFQEFLEDLSKNYLERKKVVWEELQKKIVQSITKLFAAVSTVLPDCKSGPCAVYGVDVLLRESLEPLIIGIDPVPSFPDETSARNVLYLLYAKQKLHTDVAPRHVFRASIDKGQA